LSGAVAVAGCGGGKTAATTTATSGAAAVPASIVRPVPLRTQRSIKRSAGIYAYVPARLPAGFRYYQWQFTKKPGVPSLLIWFRRKLRPDITFSASGQWSNCPGGKTLWLRGGKVYWSGNNENDQYMWLCVAGPNDQVIQLTVDSAPSTKGGPSVATLATVLHSGHPIR
jgi:hypothetical protein